MFDNQNKQKNVDPSNFLSKKHEKQIFPHGYYVLSLYNWYQFMEIFLCIQLTNPDMYTNFLTALKLKKENNIIKKCQFNVQDKVVSKQTNESKHGYNQGNYFKPF